MLRASGRMASRERGTGRGPAAGRASVLTVYWANLMVCTARMRAKRGAGVTPERVGAPVRRVGGSVSHALSQRRWSSPKAVRKGSTRGRNRPTCASVGCPGYCPGNHDLGGMGLQPEIRGAHAVRRTAHPRVGYTPPCRPVQAGERFSLEMASDALVGNCSDHHSHPVKVRQMGLLDRLMC